MKRLLSMAQRFFNTTIVLAIVLGIMALSHTYGQTSYSGILSHSNSYFTMYPYSSSYDNGTYAKIFYDGHNRRIQFWNSNSATNYTDINVGNVSSYGNLIAYNPDNTSASAFLGWQSNVARIRVGGVGSGATSGLDIQTTGNQSLMRLLSNGNVGIGTTSPTAVFEVNKSVNNQWTTRIKNTGGEALGLLIQSGYGGAQSSNNPTILQLEDNNNNIRMKVQSNGKVGIGAEQIPNGYKLAVKGKILAEEIKVETGWADYVFKEGYDLPSLAEVEQHIMEKGHLINIPAAEEVEENGIQLGEMNKLLLEKIEELTLYTLQQQEELEAQKMAYQELKEEFKNLKQLITNNHEK